MSNSVISLCNSGLSKIGVDRIASFSENTKAARLCAQQYDPIRKKLLIAHNWNFAIKRIELAQLSEAPLFDWDFQYQLPPDCLRVISIQTNDRFNVEGRVLLSDSNSILIKYITDIETVSLFSPLFDEVLSYKIGEDLAYPLVQSISLKEEMRDVANSLLKDARAYDAKEGTMDPFQQDIWIDSRRGGNSLGRGIRIDV